MRTTIYVTCALWQASFSHHSLKWNTKNLHPHLTAEQNEVRWKSYLNLRDTAEILTSATNQESASPPA